MKRLVRCAVALVAVAVLVGAGLSSARSSQEVKISSEDVKIEVVIAKLIEAYRKGDAPAMGQLYAPEVTVVPGDYKPVVSGWTNVEARYRRAYAQLTGAEMIRENTRIERRGKLAWAVYQWQFAGVAGPQTIGAQGHTTLVLEKRGRRWVIIHNHTSAVLVPEVLEETEASPPPP